MFHRVEQSPESKECQRLQGTADAAPQIARHMPPLPRSNALGLMTNDRTTDATDAVFNLICLKRSPLWGAAQADSLPSLTPSALSAVPAAGRLHPSTGVEGMKGYSMSVSESLCSPGSAGATPGRARAALRLRLPNNAVGRRGRVKLAVSPAKSGEGRTRLLDFTPDKSGKQ